MRYPCRIGKTWRTMAIVYGQYMFNLHIGKKHILLLVLQRTVVKSHTARLSGN